jgi:hypothetical protein
VVEKVEMLEDHSELRSVVIDFVACFHEVNVSQKYSSTIWNVKHIDASQERAFARSAGPKDNSSRPLVNIERDPSDDLNFSIALPNVSN